MTFLAIWDNNNIKKYDIYLYKLIYIYMKYRLLICIKTLEYQV